MTWLISIAVVFGVAAFVCIFTAIAVYIDDRFNFNIVGALVILAFLAFIVSITHEIIYGTEHSAPADITKTND